MGRLDFAMHKREGNIDFLRAQSEAKAFSLQVVDLIVAESDGVISSTRDPRGAAGG
ncbi:MAG: hypothetical protein U0521_01125 [Anaerolineae bacterium]